MEVATTPSKGISSLPWGVFPGFAAFDEAPLHDGRFSVRLDGGNFECYLQRRPGPFLFVLLSGARDPEKHPLPKFERWSWGKYFPGSILCISDPALYLKSGTLRIGWYAGTDKHNWPLRMSGLVLAIAKKLGRQSHEVIIYGSSAGGFASLMLAARLGDATAIAINPQTDVLKYSKRFVADYLAECFSGREVRELLAKERARLSAAPAMLKAARAKYLIVQNTLDKHHFEHHYKPYCQALGTPVMGGKSSDGRGASMLYSHENGHGREPQELVETIVRMGVELASHEKSRPASLPTDPSAAGTVIALNISSTKTPARRIRASQLYLLANKAQPLDQGSVTFTAPGRTDLAPYRLKPPLNWDIDPYKDRNWCAQLHMWRMFDNHLFAFDRTEDSSWLALPIRFIDDWHDFHVIRRNTSRFAWMDMMVGLRSMKLAYILSAHREGKVELSANQLAAYHELVNLHLDFLLNPEFVSYSNHTFIDMHGLAALRTLIEGDKGAQIDNFLDEVIPKLLASQFNADAVHLENSTGYQAFGIGCVKRLQSSGWFARFELDNLIRRANAVNDWFKMPDGRTVPIGDTDGAPMPANPSVTFSAQNELFNSSGYVIYRDDGDGDANRTSYLFLMAAFNSRFHKQADDLSVVWFEGEDILCDAGKFAYKASEIRGYVQSTRAHNTIEIDDQSYGETFSGKPHLIYGSAVKTAGLTEWGVFASAEVNHQKSGVRHTRHIVYGRKQWLLIIDLVGSTDGRTPHRYTQWMHFSPHLRIESHPGERYSALLRNGETLNIRTLGTHNVRSALIHGQTKPIRQGWVSQAYGKLAPNAALGYTQEDCEAAVFATLLTIGVEPSKFSLDGNREVCIQMNDATRGEAGLRLDLASGQWKY